MEQVCRQSLTWCDLVAAFLEIQWLRQRCSELALLTLAARIGDVGNVSLCRHHHT